MAPTTLGRLPSPCVISLIQQDTCPAAATQQAAEERWSCWPSSRLPSGLGLEMEPWGQGRQALLPLLSWPPGTGTPCLRRVPIDP